MIARLRLTSVERWCPALLEAVLENGGALPNNDGETLDIVIETFGKSPWCNGSAWQIADYCVEELRARAGLGPRVHDLGPRLACSHMLEMD